jgi:hypothetical protein
MMTALKEMLTEVPERRIVLTLEQLCDEEKYRRGCQESIDGVKCIFKGGRMDVVFLLLRDAS